MLVLSVTVAICLGFAAVRLCLPTGTMQPRWAARLFEASLSIGLGAALTSSLYIVSRLSGIASRLPVMAMELALLAGLSVLVMRSPARPRVAPQTAALRWNWVLGIALCVEAALAAATFAASSNANPFGGWDAWSIWNLRARFLAGDGEAWRNVFSPLLARTHPDYPLLVSGFIARCWKWMGAMPVSAPIVTAFLFLFGTIGLLVSAAALLRGASAGLLAGVVLLASPGFMAQGAMQYADVPLSFYVLAALSLLLLAEAPETPRRSAVAIAGACASFAAWTKNEGLLLFLVLMGVFFFVEGFGRGWRHAMKQQLSFLLGGAPVLLLALYFKRLLAPVADPLVAQSFSEAVARAGEPGRFFAIAKAYCTEALAFGDGWYHPVLPVLILALALRFAVSRHQRRWALTAGLTLAAVLAGYFCVYLVTPADLNWHLTTSLSRLLAHVWPAFLLLAFVLLRRIEDTASRGPAPPRPAKRRKARKVSRG